jgi:hypothetical protein
MGEVLPCISRPALTTFPEYGHPPREGLDDVERDARLARRARARGKEDAVGLQREGLLRRDLIVTEYALLHAQLTEVLDEVVGERVKVIDDEKHPP